MHHVIKRQIISLTVSSERGAFELQHRISQLHQAEILSVLQRVLDEIGPDDEVIYIDRLEIDLGNLPLKHIMEVGWISLLEETIRRQLQEMMDAKEGETTIFRRPTRAGIFDQWLFSMQHGYLPWNAGTTDEDWYLKVLEAIATDHRIAAQLRSLLAKDTLVLQRVVQQHSPVFLVPLTESLTAEKQETLARAVDELWIMIRQLERDGWPVVGLLRRGVIIAAWKMILKSVSAVATTPGAVSSWREQTLLARLVRTFFAPRQIAALLRSTQTDLPLLLPVCRRLMESAHAEGTPAGSDASAYFVADIPLREDPEATPTKLTDRRTIPADPIPQKPVASRDQAQPGQGQPGAPNEKTQPPEARGRKSADEKAVPRGHREADPSTGEVHPASNETRSTAGEVPPSLLPATAGDQPSMVSPTPSAERQGSGGQKSGDTIEAVAGEEIFAANAGVVLLHPFLHSIFKILGFVEGGQFRTPEGHTRALNLIHFLATGEPAAHEHDLFVAKLLCAWPMDLPVDGAVELTEAEMSEAGDLLTAAITQWDKLKHTSHAGLREGFLRRPGKLQVKGSDLHLQVESGSIDVLLDYLPWNLSIVKLPWMKNILRVEWR